MSSKKFKKINKRLWIFTLLLLAVLIYLPNFSPLKGWFHNPTNNSRQMLLVIAPDWNSTTGILQRYERTTTNDEWRKVGVSISVSLGDKGLGWGRGLHGFQLMPGPIVIEGAKKSPVGVFSLGLAFGKESLEQFAIKMPYKQITKTTVCPDDPKSKLYNQIVDTKSVTQDWISAENMEKYMKMGPYTYGIMIDQNYPNPKPGAGSCFFMHVYDGPGIPTLGCTAFAEPQVKEMLLWLQPDKKPVLVQLPKTVFLKLSKFWHLPS